MEKYFPEEFIQEVIERNEITDVISEYLQLKVSGTVCKGLCPFHNEKTPSFTINREKQFYKCFGCGEGGNVISFIMKKENLGFTEAVEWLAHRANLDIPLTGSIQKQKEKIEWRKELYNINKLSARFFYNNLTAKDNSAMKYLINRGFNSKIIKSFGLGYAPPNWKNLIDYLTKEGYKEKDIERSGLIKLGKDKEYFPYFKNRIMFPIFDIRGNIIAFGGRTIDDSFPKYLNSPETEVFNKSKTLYGLNIARKNIINEQIILVEGYMDVISLHQAGIKNCVASLGTSLTKEHVQTLKRICREIIICFDGDNAGLKAASKSINILEGAECGGKVLVLPTGMDPDDFIRKKGRMAFEEQTACSLSLTEYKIHLAKNKYPLESFEDRVRLGKEIADILSKLKSPIEQDLYLKKIEDETGISKEAIKLEIYSKTSFFPKKDNVKYTSSHKRDNKYIEAVPPVEQRGYIIAEKQLIKLMIINPQLIEYIFNRINKEDFILDKHALIIEQMLMNQHSIIDSDDIEAYFSGLEEDIQEILNTDTSHIEIDKALDKFIINLRRYKLFYQLKKLQQEQNEVISDSNLNKEEVENALLEVSIKVMKINIELQKLQQL